MGYEVKFEWLIEDFSEFLRSPRKGKDSVSVKSQIFAASADETNHQWQLELKCLSKVYTVFIRLIDDSFLKPVFARCVIYSLNFKNEGFRKSPLRETYHDYAKHKVLCKNLFTHEGLSKETLKFTKPITIVCEMEFKEKKPRSPDSIDLKRYQYAMFGAKLFQQLKDQNSTDVNIVCQGKEFKAHRFILRAASLSFDSMLIKSEEGSVHTLFFDDICPEQFEIIIQFMYTGEVNLNYNIAMDLLKIARKYGMVVLQDLCLSEIGNNLDATTAVEVLSIASELGDRVMEANALEFIKQNISCVLKTSAWLEVMIKRGDLMDKLIRLMAS